MVTLPFQRHSKVQIQKIKKRHRQKEAALRDQGGVLTAEEQQAQLAYARANPAEFADFNVPWSLSLSYSMSFSRAD